MAMQARAPHLIKPDCKQAVSSKRLSDFGRRMIDIANLPMPTVHGREGYPLDMLHGSMCSSDAVVGYACAEAKAEAMLVTAIDEVAWVLNLRGADVDYNPVFVSYLLVTPGETTLYVDPQKVRSLSCMLGIVCGCSSIGSS